MWMTDYVREVKRQLRDVYGFQPTRVVGDEPCFDLPDGDYPMTIEGKRDNVRIIDGKFSLCNFEMSDEEAGGNG